VVRAANGDTLDGRDIRWQTSDSTILKVTQAGVVVPLKPGTAEVSASTQRVRGRTLVTVLSSKSSATVTVTPADASVRVGATTTLVANVRGADGADAPGEHKVRWVSSDTSVATVDSTSGQLTARKEGDVEIAAIDASGARGVAAVHVSTKRPALRLTLASRVLGVGHAAPISVALKDTDGTVAGQTLRWTSTNPAVAEVDSHGILTAKALGRAKITAQAEGGLVGSMDVSVTEVAVARAGGDQTCAVRSDGARQCWGAGTGSPGALLSSPLFESLSVSATHACGLTREGEAFCWGDNAQGELGDRSTARHREPAPVRSGLRFRSISAGNGFTCAITTASRPMCWGADDKGQLGNGVRQDSRTSPDTVSAGEPFVAIVAGTSHACGIGASNRGYCWGSDSDGQLGTPDRRDFVSPASIKGNWVFRKIALGDQHSCGLTLDGQVLCWGSNRGGQIGDGSRSAMQTGPVGVKVDRRRVQFVDVAAGANHSCGLRADGGVLCWGDNTAGQLGDGTLNGTNTPRDVRTSMKFRSITAGRNHTCGVGTDGKLYCWGGNGRGQFGPGPQVVMVPTIVPGS
jgi:uncharacterized protein YjdB